MKHFPQVIKLCHNVGFRENAQKGWWKTAELKCSHLNTSTTWKYLHLLCVISINYQCFSIKIHIIFLYKCFRRLLCTPLILKSKTKNELLTRKNVQASLLVIYSRREHRIKLPLLLYSYLRRDLAFGHFWRKNNHAKLLTLYYMTNSNIKTLCMF